MYFVIDNCICWPLYWPLKHTNRVPDCLAYICRAGPWIVIMSKSLILIFADSQAFFNVHVRGVLTICLQTYHPSCLPTKCSLFKQTCQEMGLPEKSK